MQVPFDMLNHIDSLELWGDKPLTRDYKKALKNVTNNSNCKRLFNALTQEIEHNTKSTVLLSSAHISLQSASKNKGNPVVALDSVEFNAKICREASDEVEEIVKPKIEQCCECFQSPNDPILLDADMDRIVEVIQ